MMQSFQVPEQIDEDILAPPPPPDFEPVPDGPTTYEKVRSSSQRGKDKLIDNNGYTFTYRKTYASGNLLWRCSVQNKATTCSASVTQAGDTFTKGGQPNCHQPNQALQQLRKCPEKLKMLPCQTSSLLLHPLSIVILSQKDNDPCILKPSNLARQANRKRQKQRPNNPTEIDFNLDHIPSDFFLADISNNDRRHLLFATDRQLQLLANAKVWYVDGTFRVVRQPFSQLFSIHAFVRGHEDNIKQVPLVFVLMSGRKQSDYQAVLTELKSKLPENINLVKIVANFEASF